MKIKFLIKNLSKVIDIAPTKLIIISFIGLILFGTTLLNLPFASKDGKSSGLLVALFTSTSASCVTNLTIVDTKEHWSLFGQCVILGLIQLGGLGIITLTTFFSVLFKIRVGLKGMILAQESLNHFSFSGILNLTKKVVIATFCIEFFGALIMSFSFVKKFGLKGFYYGIFHSVSAFCNAGFDIIGSNKSMTEYNDDPYIIYTIACLIVIGGLGFLVWKDLYEYRITKSLSLHTKVVIIMTSFLIITGTLFFFAFEHDNPGTMGNLSLFEKINASVFHSVATRTAGFSSVPLSKMHEISKITTIILMFIGAAPGSTAGGIKITTIAVIIMAIVCQLKGLRHTLIFKKSIAFFIVIKSISIIALSFLLVITVTTICLSIESNKSFIDILYEVTSAFGTVGLSVTNTSTLMPLTKILLILTMFLGRLGPVSFAIALTIKNNKKVTDVIYPEGKIIVG